MCERTNVVYAFDDITTCRVRVSKIRSDTHHRNTGYPVRYIPSQLALSTLSLCHIRLGMVLHVAVRFSSVSCVHELLSVASLLP